MTPSKQHLKPGRQTTILTLLILSFFLCIFVTRANAAQKGAWQAENPEAAIVAEIRGENSSLTEDNNRNIIEVKARIKPHDSSSRDLKTKEIILEGKTIVNKSVAWKLEPVGIGMVGNNNKCFYQFPHTLIKGAEGLSIASAGEIKLSREKEGAPAVVSLIKSPTHICLAFSAPQGVNGKLTFHLADSQFPVSLLHKGK